MGDERSDDLGIGTTDDFFQSVGTDVMRGLKKIYLRIFKEKGKVVLLGDFNARVGRSVQIDDIIGIIEKDTCNANGNRFLSF